MITFTKSLPFNRLRDYLKVSLPHLTLKKIVNIFHTEINYALRKEKVSSFPYFLTVDPTNICQLRCPLCSTGQGKSSRPKGKMNFTLFKKIIDELEDYLLEVHLIWWGEPLLNKEILKFVKYANEKNIATFISTNFSLPLSEVFLKEMVVSGLDVLNVSLDGITPTVYNKYRVGGDFDMVTGNIKALAKIRKKLKAKNPRIEWQFLVNKYNEDQIPKLDKFAKSLGVDSLILEQLLVLFGQADRGQVNLKDWLPKNMKYQPKNFSLETNKSDNLNRGQCWWLWRGVAISHDGGVSPCCYNNLKEEDFGDMLNDSFVNIWNNEKYLSARSLFNKKKQLTRTICNKCKIANTK